MDLDEFGLDNYRIPFAEVDRWREYLKKNGFVVIANYLTRERCQKAVDKIWDIMYILSEGKVVKADPQTHGVNQNYPPLLHGGMSQYVGHSQIQWDLRKECKPIFQQLWKTQNLKSSFDGFCFMNGARKYQKVPNNSFLHCDQSPLKNYLWSYQGIMTLTDSKQNQGGFVCVPRSHLLHHKFFEDRNLLGHRNDWYAVAEQDKIKQPLCYDMKLDTEAGDFILFDSRTFHCNTVPTSDCLRVCTYVCMLPTQKIGERFLEGRVKGFKQRRVSNHHPGDGFRTFAELPKQAKNPQNFRKLIAKSNDFQMDEQIQQLV